MQTIMEMLYVVMPSVPLDQKLYAVPYLGHEDLPQQIDPSMEDLTTTNLNSIRVSAIVARAKYTRECFGTNNYYFSFMQDCVLMHQVLRIENEGMHSYY